MYETTVYKTEHYESELQMAWTELIRFCNEHPSTAPGKTRKNLILIDFDSILFNYLTLIDFNQFRSIWIG